MKALLLLGFMVLLPLRFAQAGTIALLTSLHVSAAKLKKIEAKFRANFDSFPHELKVYHAAGPTEIFNVLHSPDTISVIWVSHASKEETLTEGLAAREVIQDIWGNDVRHFFSTVHPNLRYLGIVGCQTRGIVEDYDTNGHYANNPNLVIHSEVKKVELFRSFNRALKAGIKALDLPHDTFAPLNVEDQITFQIERTPGKSGWLVIGDEVLGTLTEDHLDNRYELSYSKEKWEGLTNKNIRFIENLQYANTKDQLGLLKIKIRQDGSVKWSGFKDKEGALIGRGRQNLYIYRENKDS